MSLKNTFAKTMRIDIRADSPKEVLRVEKPEPVAPAVPAPSAQAGRGAAKSPPPPEYKQLLQSIYDAVVITNPRGRIIDFNERAIEFFRCKDSEIVGTKVTDLISGSDNSILAAIWKNLEDKRYTLIEAHCVRKDKTTFPAEIAVNKIELVDGRQLSFFIRDVTVRKRAQAALEEAVARLEEHDRARSLFVSNVSHELKTPLTSMIYAIANLLRGVAGPLPDKVKHYLELLNGDCKRLANTVSDILDLRKIDTRTLSVAKTKVPIVRLVRRTVESLEVQSERKGIKLSVVAVGKWFVDCDQQKIERVILNVAGNAVKFTPENGSIKVTVEEGRTRQGYVVVTVQDNGVGIPPEAISRVAERYFTVGDQPTGSGLGLAISKEIIELHGGKMTIVSPPPGAEKGTAVSVDLPVAAPPVVLLAGAHTPLVAELSRQMHAHGYAVLFSKDGQEAARKAALEKPDILLVDIASPGINGTDFVLKMKSDGHTARIPIIAVKNVRLQRGISEVLTNFSIPVFHAPWNEEEMMERVDAALLGFSMLSESKEDVVNADAN